MTAQFWAQNSARNWPRLAAVCAAMALAGAICAVPATAQGSRKAKPTAAAGEGEEAAAKETQKQKVLSPAEAKAAIDAAAKLLEAGKSEPAVQALTTTLAAGHLPPAIMAKALLYRGTAYRQLQKPAQAIADLTSALWLKGGLTDNDRADALKQRAAAYGEAGLSDSGAIAHGPGSATLASGATPSAAPSSSGWNLFGNLFGAPSSASASPPAAPAPAQPPGAATAAPPAPAAASTSSSEATASAPPKATSGWSRNTRVRGGTAEIETATLPAKQEGRFRIQIGMVRTHVQAQEMAVKVKTRYGDVVGQREPEIDETVVGNMGSFYRVRVGPFASPQEGHAACAKLKGSGLDCLVVAQ